MTNQELIQRLRELAGSSIAGFLHAKAADAIESLANRESELVAEVDRLRSLSATTAQAMVYQSLLIKYESLAKQHAAMREALGRIARLATGRSTAWLAQIEREVKQVLSPDAGRDYVSKVRVIAECKLDGPFMPNLIERINAL